MAAGFVLHDITTATGVTFQLTCWVPDTSAPDVSAIAVAMEYRPTTIVSGQVAPTSSAATLLAARTARQRVTFKNTGSVIVFIGPATVTTGNGFPLNPGESYTSTSSALFQAITTSGTGAIAYIEEY